MLTKRKQRTAVAAIFLLLLLVVVPGASRLMLVWKPRLYDAVGCIILSTEGKIIKYFDGEHCIFFPDGHYLVYSRKIKGSDEDYGTLTKYSPVGKPLWKIRGLHIHHQLKLSADGSEILYLGSEALQRGAFKVRYDEFVVMDHNGKVLRKFRSSEHEKELDGYAAVKGWITPPEGWKKQINKWRPGIEKEHAHANSIYEIPENPHSSKHEAFKPGNYIVGYHLRGFLAILDRSMTKVLWHKKFPSQFHDVQVMANGNLLIYENAGADGNGRLLIQDPFTDKVVWSYQANPPERFRPEILGGIQALPDGTFLFTDATIRRKGYVVHIDADGKELQRYLSPFASSEEYLNEGDLQDVRRVDLSEFLRNNET